MSAVRDKSRAAADQMNAAAKNAEQAIRCVIHMLPQTVCRCRKVLFLSNMYPGRKNRTESREKSV